MGGVSNARCGQTSGGSRGATGGHGPPQTEKKNFFFDTTYLFKWYKKNFLPLPTKLLGKLHGTSSTTPPPRNLAGKLHQLPPLEFTEPHRLPPPPSKFGRKTPSTTPPRIHGRNGNSPPQIKFLDPPLGQTCSQQLKLTKFLLEVELEVKLINQTTSPASFRLLGRVCVMMHEVNNSPSAVTPRRTDCLNWHAVTAIRMPFH